ncbi:MAG: DMT family transporter [Gammaproteobacteria bacterium]|nr:MAG: DMT family transporter [Gammaproteobacteria bacterium]
MALNWFHRLPDNLKGIAYLMLASLVFSLMALMIKLLGQRLHLTQILLVRQIGMVVMVAPAILRNFPGSLRSARPGLQLLRVGCALVAMLCGFTAVIHMPLADATAIFFAKSFFVTILAVLFLAETVGVYRWSAVLIGFAGVLIMLQPGTDNFSIYGLASLTGAAGAAAVMILLRLLSRSDSPDTILSYGALGVGLVMILPGIYFWQRPTASEWFLLAAVAVVSYFAQKCNIFAYKHGEASLLASLDYVRLLWATLLGYLIFDQFPGLPTWFGAVIVIAAAIFTIYRETRRKQGWNSVRSGNDEN